MTPSHKEIVAPAKAQPSRYPCDDLACRNAHRSCKSFPGAHLHRAPLRPSKLPLTLTLGGLFNQFEWVSPMAVAVIASLASFLLGMITVRMAGLRHEVIGGLLGLTWFWWTFIWLMQNKRREIEAIKKELERMYRRLNF